ncbi:MAG: hypothetical protein O7G85_03735, partial [Planctomycetota bacterium]|nr:hypothetical protein [Planctomycetota bacterium]
SWAPVRWPIQPTERWKRIGRSGEPWRELTNRLIDPNAPAKGELPEFEELIRTLPFEPRNYGRIVKFAGAAVLLIALGAVIYPLYMSRRLTLDQAMEVRNMVERISLEHMEWLDAFREDMNLALSTGESGLHPSADPEFAPAIVQPLRDAAGLDEVEGNDFFECTNYFKRWEKKWKNPPESWAQIYGFVKSEIDFEEFRLQFDQNDERDIREIHQLVQDVRAKIDELLPPRMQGHLDTLEAREWIIASLPISDLLAQMEANDVDYKPRFEHLADIMRRDRQLSEIDEVWQGVEEIERSKTGSGEAALGRFQPIFQTIFSEAETVNDIHATLVAEAANKALVETVRDIASTPDDQIRWDLFDDDEFKVPSDWTLDHFQVWSSSLKGFYKIANPPTLPPDCEQKLASFMDMLNEVYDCGGKDDALELTQHYALASTQRDQLLNLHAIAKHKEALVEASKNLKVLQTQINLCVELRKQVCVPPPEYFQEMSNVKFTSPALNSVWEVVVTSINELGTMPSEPSAEQQIQYMKMRKPTDGTRKVFEHLDALAFHVDDPAPEAGEFAPLPPGPKSWDRDEAVRAVGDRREQAITTAIQSVRQVAQVGDKPTLETTAIADTIALEQQGFEDWVGQASDLIESFRTIEQQLDWGYTLGDIEGEYRAWAIDQTQLFDALRPSLGELVMRYEFLLALRSETNPETIRTQIGDLVAYDRPEAYLGTWNRYGELPHDRLLDDDAVLDGLKSWLDTHLNDNNARRQELESRLKNEAHDRWVAHLQGRTAPRTEDENVIQAYEADYVLAAKFDVRRADLNPSLGFNYDLHEFRDSLRAIERDEQGDPDQKQQQAKLGIDTYHDAMLRQFRNLIDAQPDLGGIMTTLVEIASEEQAAVDVQEIGPAAGPFGFSYVEVPGVARPRGPNGPPKVIRYRHNRSNLELSFVLLDSKDHSDLLERPIYIATDELPLEAFLKVANHPTHQTTLKDALYLETGINDLRQGPRVWERHPQTNKRTPSFRAADDWLATQSKRLNDYPPTQAPPPAPTSRPPTQHVSMIASAYVAAALGCRLPTTDEFRAAIREQYGAELTNDAIVQSLNNGNMASGSINLCDAKVKTQYDFAIAERRRDSTLKPFAPDLGSFYTGLFPPYKTFDKFQENENQATFHYDLGRADTTLWFMETKAPIDGSFNNLYGNVLEWVYDRPDDLALEPGETIPAPGELRKRIALDQFGVVGGSALAPVSVLLNERLSLPRELLPMRYNQNGFSDVGFRLVIAGKFDTMAEQALAATSFAYLNP